MSALLIDCRELKPTIEAIHILLTNVSGYDQKFGGVRINSRYSKLNDIKKILDSIICKCNEQKFNFVPITFAVSIYKLIQQIPNGIECLLAVEKQQDDVEKQQDAVEKQQDDVEKLYQTYHKRMMETLKIINNDEIRAIDDTIIIVDITDIKKTIKCIHLIITEYISKHKSIGNVHVKFDDYQRLSDIENSLANIIDLISKTDSQGDTRNQTNPLKMVTFDFVISLYKSIQQIPDKIPDKIQCCLYITHQEHNSFVNEYQQLYTKLMKQLDE